MDSPVNHRRSGTVYPQWPSIEIRRLGIQGIGGIGDPAGNTGAKYEITLTTKDASDEVKSLIGKMPMKEIIQHCQHAVEKAEIHNVKLLGANKVINGIRIQCQTEEQAKQLRESKINWNNAFTGVTTHRPSYGVVVHGIPIDELNLTDPKVTKFLEVANGLQSEVISKVTPLRCKNKQTSEKAKHHSIVIYTNDP